MENVKTVGDFWKKVSISKDFHVKISNYCKNVGIEFISTPFDFESVDILDELGVKRYKIASRTCLLKDPFSLETLKAKSDTKKPVIISMGMGGNKKKIER